MFDLLRVFKQSVAGALASFVAAFPAAEIVGNLNVGKAAVVAAIAAAIGTAAGLIGALIKQLIERARGIVGVSADAAVQLLGEAQEKIAEARSQLS